MQNDIEKRRKDVEQFFDPNSAVRDSESEVASPDGKYFFRSCKYPQTDPERNWAVTKIELYRKADGSKLFEFLRNDDFVPYLWLSRDGADYFICPEDLEGQSIYDITNDKFYSFAPRKDDFIWVEIIASPDRSKLAAFGCIWAYPYEVVVYDIANICELPYPVITRRTLKGPEAMKAWKDDTTILIEDNGKQIPFIITG